MLPVRFMGGTGAALAAAGSQAYLTDLTERSHLPFGENREKSSSYLKWKKIEMTMFFSIESYETWSLSVIEL